MSNFYIERLEADGTTYTDVTGNWQVSEGTQSVSNGSSFGGIFLEFIDFDAAQTGNVNLTAIGNNGPLDGIARFDYTEMLTVEGALMRLQRSGDIGDGSLKLVDVSTSVPEPGTLALLGLALAGFGFRRRF
ncbi:PEP-CTERM sorting domain-containing protein [Marinobacter salinisoli]|uniref:PEP-CTERM sorting domain-containing protein n=2 Tax=Marinobacter salinisoli TaxID=2769486 RepID=A0ABX7MVQ3_9GAMM|nr:PEP-CTERM sorting domain-containing protein [Marinobacter salinisoli]